MSCMKNPWCLDLSNDNEKRFEVTACREQGTSTYVTQQVSILQEMNGFKM